MSKSLSDLVVPSVRFARSANVERDTEGSSLGGYRPTGRSIDIVTRFARAMANGDGGRAFSITGPYGSGKSSLAVFLDALLRPAGDPLNRLATELLRSVSADASDRLREGHAVLGSTEKGFIRALATADREAVSTTVARALTAGVRRFGSASNAKSIMKLGDSSGSVGTARRIVEVVCELAYQTPVLLLVDEFGKNLEAFAQTGRSDADLFLLQQLAEAGQGASALPIFLVTLQHLSFDDYAAAAGQSQRREWVKIQGRFEDVAYVDTPAQTRALIGAALSFRGSEEESAAIEGWAAEQVELGRSLGLPLRDPVEVAAAFPLHPTALLVLPDLCARFGQYERTLFSFLTGPEANALPEFLKSNSWDIKEEPHTLGPDSVYDYFIESARNMVSAGPSASRWLEIETILRDSHGLSVGEQRAAKTIAVLNLVSSGGPLRASQSLLEWVLGPDTGRVLKDMENRGLLIYREFADDYRIWRGSDLDLRTEIDEARRRLKGTPISMLLEQIHPLPPIVAARHSIETGTLRVFTRRYVDCHSVDLIALNRRESLDGLLGYLVDPDAQMPDVALGETLSGPVVIAVPSSIEGLQTSAMELAAILEVLQSNPSVSEDRVARQELNERAAAARHDLDAKLSKAFCEIACWHRLDDGKETFETPEPVSGVLSKICYEAYPETPRVPNEMLNRTSLTSQGAKARRVLIEAMLTNAHTECLGISGFGPERAMYEAILKHQGIHTFTGDTWNLTSPHPRSGVAGAWGTIEEWLGKARKERVSLADLYEALMEPPLGMRAGPIPVLITAALLVHSDQIAIYEHGTFKPTLTPETSERMVANPQFFELKHVASQGGLRGQYVQELLLKLNVQAPKRAANIPSVLAVVSHLVRTVAALPNYTMGCEGLSPRATALRGCIGSATEPDELLFVAIPEALGFPALDSASAIYGEKGSGRNLQPIVDALLTGLGELEAAYPNLLQRITNAVVSLTKVRRVSEYRADLQARSHLLKDALVDPGLKPFVIALGEEHLDDTEWAIRVATCVGKAPPSNWEHDDWALFETRLKELSSAMIRVETINFDRTWQTEGFDAVRLTVTRPDGAEAAEVVAIEHLHKAPAERILGEAIHRLSVEIGATSEVARTALLASIAANFVPNLESSKNVTPIDQNAEKHSKQTG